MANNRLTWLENTQSERLALSKRTFLVSEEELPLFIPYSLADIRKMRAADLLPYVNDPLGRKRKVLYNLRDVEATFLSGQKRSGPLVREIDYSALAV